MRKVECHERVSSNHPANSGPRAMARPDVAAHAAMARARSAAGNVATRRESVAGMMIAAPTPMTIRAAITDVVLSARLPNTAPPPKTSRPAKRAPRRLYLSPMTPNSSISAA